MYFYNVSLEQAVTFRGHVIAREPFRLRDLAVRMRDTGGPIDAMDTSMASLVPLWEWFVEYASVGCPGVPDDASPSLWPVLGRADRTPEQDATRRRAAAGEGLAHYSRLALARVDPPAPWEVYVQPKRRREADHHSTGVRLSNGGFIFLDNLGYAAEKALNGSPRDLSPARLQDLVLLWCPPSFAQVRQEQHPSVLVPYLTADLGPMPEIARLSPVAQWEAEEAAAKAAGTPAPPAEPRAGSEMVLARGPGIGLDDEPWLLRPLSTETVARGLTAAGFTNDDTDHVPPADLLIDDAQFMHRDGVAVISTLIHDGALRALFLEPVAGDHAQWYLMIASLYDLANDLGARLAPEDEFE